METGAVTAPSVGGGSSAAGGASEGGGIAKKKAAKVKSAAREGIHPKRVKGSKGAPLSLKDKCMSGPAIQKLFKSVHYRKRMRLSKDAAKAIGDFLYRYTEKTTNGSLDCMKNRDKLRTTMYPPDVQAAVHKRTRCSRVFPMPKEEEPKTNGKK